MKTTRTLIVSIAAAFAFMPLLAFAQTAPTLSPDGSTLIRGTNGSLVTADGTWTFSTSQYNAAGNQIYLNGSQAAAGSGVKLIVQNHGVMYTMNAFNQWFYWQAGNWHATSNATGHFDTISKNADGSYTASGWVCVQASTTPLTVQLALSGAWPVTSPQLANGYTEDAVRAACGVSTGSYRFYIPLSASFAKTNAGLRADIYATVPGTISYYVVPHSANILIPTPVQAPTVTLTASPTSITPGQSATLTWSSTNADSCTGTNFTTTGTSGSVFVTPTTTTTYIIACSGGGGSVVSTVVVNVAHGVPPAATLEIIGTPEPVYVWATQQCNSTDIPDEPAHAYRMANGKVALMASNSDNNNRSIGSSLDTVVHTCTKTYLSHKDTTYDNFQYQEWLNAPYTLDGTTVYSLNHNEWYPKQTLYPSCAVGGGWVNAIDFAVSHDGGASFTQPSNYIVLRPATEWSSSFPCGSVSNPGKTLYGDFGSSNIIHYNNYYWSYFVYRPAPGEAGAARTCLMRTSNLADASSWEEWNGTGYSRGQAVTNCAAIPNLAGGTPHVAYSTYLHTYVGLVVENDATYFGTSDDLLHWSGLKRIVGGIPSTLTTMSPYALPYGSFLDPTDTSMNFENVGQTPYIYFTVYHPGSGGYNRDLYRVKVRFSDGTQPVTGNKNPIGAFANATSTSLQGWTYDPNASSTAITISIYADGPKGAGTLAASIATNVVRNDINTGNNITGTHGFNWIIPAQYRTATHTWYIYAQDAQTETWLQLIGSPKTTAAAAPTDTFTASPASITQGQSSTLTWNSTNTTSCTGVNFTATSTSGSVTVTPRVTTTYIISCTGNGGILAKTVTVVVAAQAPTVSMTISPASPEVGQTATLSWSATNAASCTGVNFSATSTAGIYSVTPAAAMTYTITCTGQGGGTVTRSTTINPIHVNEKPSATAAIVGLPQPVYVWQTQKCNSWDIPDEPAVAYRMANGQVALVDSNAGSNNRFIGSSLNTVVHTCPTTYASHTDPVTDHYQYFEWLLAPYTFDGTTIYSLIHSEWYGYVADKSCAMNGNGAWLNAITYASSNNSGASFTQPSNYLILRSPTEWSSTFPCGSATNPGRTQFGDFGSSNIIPKDGYYWSYFIYGPAPGETGKSRECLMRTNNLADPQSWEVWNGAGYSRGQEVTNCAAIDGPTVGSPSIRYSTYLHAYISIGWNLTYRTSKDLITWSAPKPIAGSIPADLLNQTGGLTYASLLDPNDASMNFDNVGQTAYIYFTVMHGGNDRDIYRVKVQFNDGPLPVPPPNQMPIGAVGAATSTSLQGWAYDPNASSTPITISIYVGGTRFTGTEIASYTTDQLRTDVNGAQGITGTHGFRWSIPSQYLSAQHTWFVYAKDNELNTWSLLAGSPRTNVIITPTPTTTPPTATIDAISLSATAQTNINVRGTATHATIITVNSVPVTVTNGNWSINLSPRAAGTYPIAVYDSTGTRLLASGVITVGAPQVNHLPTGVLGTLTSTYLQGWVYDPDATSTPVTLSIYVDGAKGTGSNVFATLADIPRSDVAAGAHGYHWLIPAAYQTTPHTWYVYAQDIQTRAWTLLSGSPKMQATSQSFLGANATPVTALKDSVALCNSAIFAQVPTDHNLFLGRVLQNTTTTPCNGNKWGLGLFQMNWTTHTLTFLRYVLQPPVTLSIKTLASVYDPSIVSYNGELWVSFECAGVGIVGASSCVGPLNLTSGIDISRITILANGTASDPNSPYFYSASVPNLFVFNGNLYVYWGAIRSDKTTGTWESSTIRGMQLTENAEGKLWGVNSGGRTVSSYDPAHNVEIAAPDPSDPLTNTTVDIKGLYADANYIYLITTLGGNAGGTVPCVKNTPSIPGCWRMQILRSSAPLAHIDLSHQLIAPALPSNPAAYQRFLVDPSGAQEIIGTFFAPTSASATNVILTGLSLYPISLPSLQFNGTSSLDSSNLLSLTAAAIAAPFQVIADTLANLFYQLGAY